jgi:hypothetical protein
MIDHSQDLYNELPAELYRRPRLRHSRPYPRASPYPADVPRRSLKCSISPRARIATESVEHALALLPPMYDPVSRSPRPVQESPIASHTGMGLLSPAPASALSTLAPLSPLVVNVQAPVVTEGKASKQNVLSRVTAGARRNALGWGRRKAADENSANGKLHVTQTVAPTAAKENEGTGMMAR